MITSIKTGIEIGGLCSKFIFKKHKNIFLFLSVLNTKVDQAVEILPCVAQGAIYPAWLMQWLLMDWRRKEPGHQQLWCWPSYPVIFRLQSQRDQRYSISLGVSLNQGNVTPNQWNSQWLHWMLYIFIHSRDDSYLLCCTICHWSIISV